MLMCNPQNFPEVDYQDLFNHNRKPLSGVNQKQDA